MEPGINSPPRLAAGTSVGPVAVTSAGGRVFGLRAPRLLAMLVDADRWASVALTADSTALVAAVVLALRGLDPWSLPLLVIAPVLAFPGLAVATITSTRRSITRLRSSAVEDLLGGAAGVVAVGALVGAAPMWLGAGDGAAHLLVTASLYGALLLCLLRAPLLALRYWARVHGVGAQRTLIVGAGVVGSELARRLADDAAYGLEPVGFLDADPPDGPASGRDLPVLGAPADLAAIARRMDATQVLVAYVQDADSTLRHVIAEGARAGLNVAVVPRLFDAVSENAALDSVGGLAVMHLRPPDPLGWQFALKHGVDRCAAGLGLLAVAPLLLVLALGVRLGSPGPVLFRQARIGRDGQAFEILKFRSMRVGAGGSFQPVAGSAPGGVEGDDRRTLIGAFMRRTSLDELPQLLNVLRGEMSLVGPRPERPEFVRLFATDIDRYGERHRVRSGITGLAQVRGLRGQTRLDDRVRYDNWYIENFSLGLDARILLSTVGAVLRRAE